MEKYLQIFFFNRRPLNRQLNTKICKRTIYKLKNEETPIYLAFLQFVGQIFEAVLLQLQQPSLIHILYPPTCDLITEVLTKFVRKKYLYEGE